MYIFRSLQTRIWLALSTIILLTLTLFAVGFAAQVSPLQERLQYGLLREQVLPVRGLVVEHLGENANLDQLVALLNAPANRDRPRPRTLVVRPDGRVLFDTVRSPEASLANKRIARWRRVFGPFARPPAYWGEFRDAQGQRWLVMGVPISLRGREYILAVARAYGSSDVWRQIERPLLLSVLTALGGGLIVAMFVALWLGRPIRQMREAIQAIAGGQLDARLDPERVPQEFVNLAESFNAMVAEVKRTREAQRNFVSNVSHDLKTPITSIRGFAQALREGIITDPDKQKEAADIIYEEADRMHRLVMQLLELARIDAGQLTLRRERVNLSAQLEHLVESLRFRAQEAGVTVNMAVVPEMYVNGDADRLLQVFGNLLDNAIKHTPPGGEVRVETWTAEENQGAMAVVSVIDTGPGIPKEDLPHIFDRFYRGDKARASGQGTGLGLAIVKELVEAHGGRVSVQSVQGLGTRFTVHVPLATS